MAIIFGKRSAYVVSMGWSSLLIFALLLVLVALVSVAAPIINKFGWAGLLAEIGVLMVVLDFIEGRMKITDRILDGLFGEDTIAAELKKLPDNYAVLRGIKVKDRLDVDCTVVGPTGVHAVEVKSHKGRIGFDGEQLTRNGRRFPKDFLRQVNAEAFGLREKIRALARIDLFVEAVLVFSSRYAGIRFGDQKIHGCRVIGREWLNSVVGTSFGQKLKEEHIFKIAGTLANETTDKHKEEKLIQLKKVLGLNI